jgi:hypothetical protein
MTYKELLRDKTFLELANKIRETAYQKKPITYTEDSNRDHKVLYQVVPSVLTARENYILIDLFDFNINIVIGCSNSKWKINKEVTPDGESYSLIRDDGAIFGFDF